ncbi:serine/threonine protein kinase [Blastocystis sp. subtype 4]|uniref:serine/threonine protein kinase n=1 Tax=Blastocystis sp. subtype 4 TaxID=944170 RepID=UPI000711AF62|nr:serine/threonine protein kinase [Blastocystis sp. subtype 4]KNB41781.1 serine/threonine protein kinase [Blastocystis sp. subtype 4]|eukprot:XP_014525224.1 serine/threonine protein kinase [Blastocystis sp. subtype 4]
MSYEHWKQSVRTGFNVGTLLRRHSGIEKESWSFDSFGFSKCLGAGQYGKVFLAKEKNSGAIIAIKVIWFKNYIENGIQDQIKNEIEIQSHLVHNRIVRVYGMFHDEEKLGIVMEYAPFGTLFNMMCLPEYKDGFSKVLVQQIALQVYSALMYCHSHNVMHRDLKPENILIFSRHTDENGRLCLDVKLTDFGWSVVNHGATRKTVCGTKSYMAPEILNAVGNVGYSYEAESYACESMGVI